MSHVYLYVPYASEHGAGMQRFASEMVQALGRAGLESTLVVGEVYGQPAWLEGVEHTVALGAWSARVPRAVAALARLAWLQTVFPVRAGRGAVLVALAHELPVIPAARQIAVVHDMTDYRAFAGRGSAPTRLRNRLWRAGLERSDAIIAISGATRDDLAETLSLDARRVSVVYEGVDRARFSPAAATQAATSQAAARPFFLYAGTLDSHKNVAFLMSVFAEIIERGLDADLVLAGSQPPARVEALMSSLPAEAARRVQWAGFVSDAELARLFSTCTAFTFPSLNEGFGLAVAEAMACGAPVVSSGAGSLAEVVGDGGIVLAPDDRGAWVEALQQILTDVDYRERLVGRALARSRAFSWDRAAAAYRSVIDSVRP